MPTVVTNGFQLWWPSMRAISAAMPWGGDAHRSRSRSGNINCGILGTTGMGNISLYNTQTTLEAPANLKCCGMRWLSRWGDWPHGPTHWWTNLPPCNSLQCAGVPCSKRFSTIISREHSKCWGVLQLEKFTGRLLYWYCIGWVWLSSTSTVGKECVAEAARTPPRLPARNRSLVTFLDTK